MVNVANPIIDNLELSHVSTYQSGIAQSKTFRRLQAYFAACLKRHALTPNQWFVIGTVYDAGDVGIGMSQLADAMGSTLASLTETVTILELKGWIVKKSNIFDGRARVLTVEPSRRGRCIEIEEDLRNQLRQTIYARITREELITYIRVLYKLMNM